MVRREPDPIRITTATRSHSEDISARQRRYVISMTIRTLCFLLAVVSIGHWFMWVFLAASFVLPYVAVVMANAGSSKSDGFALLGGASGSRQLPPGEESTRTPREDHL
jgi:Protein of unknown function (DUF3099)